MPTYKKENDELRAKNALIKRELDKALEDNARLNNELREMKERRCKKACL